MPACGFLPSSAGVTTCASRDQAEAIEARATRVFPDGYRVEPWPQA
jgi:hypothetical protein